MTVSVGGVSVWQSGLGVGLSGTPSPSLTVEDARILAGALHVLADAADAARGRERDQEDLDRKLVTAFGALDELAERFPFMVPGRLEVPEPRPPTAEGTHRAVG